MSLLDDIPPGALVGVDTAPFIYLIEQHSVYGPVVHPFFIQRVALGLNPIVTSVISLAEVLVKPITMRRVDLVDSYRSLLTKGPHLTLLGLSQTSAERAAALRADYGFRLPDALQLAAAGEAGASHFLTNDARLKVVQGLKVIVLRDYLASPAP